MKLTAIKTDPITSQSHSYEQLLAALPTLTERSIVAISSKAVALCQGRTTSDQTSKQDLVKKEAEYYLPAEENAYGISLTITHGILIPNAGIDSSNGNGSFVLWPDNPQQAAEDLRNILANLHNLTHVGVIITDSKTSPLQWGTTGVALAHSGFEAINDYIGESDIFGRILEVSKSNIRDGLAAAATVVMGEGNEQTPLVLIEDLPFVKFTSTPQTTAAIPLDDDLYAPLLTAVDWQTGEHVDRNDSI